MTKMGKLGFIFAGFLRNSAAKEVYFLLRIDFRNLLQQFGSALKSSPRGGALAAFSLPVPDYFIFKGE